MRIVLIGQAAFGEAVYRKLLEQQEEVVAVFYEREGDPLHVLATEQGIVSHPTNMLRKEDFFSTYSALAPDINVMAFVTVIIPESVIEFPTHGTIQYHPSLLPLHRGRSAINWAIINGENETGISIFWPDKGIDTGPILMQKTSAISPEDTVGTLYRNQLFPQGVEALAESVDLIKENKAPKLIQDESKSTYEPPCEGLLAKIEWYRPANQVVNHIRGCDPAPGAYSVIRNETVALLNVEFGTRENAAMYGEVIAIEDTGIRIALNGGSVLVKRVRRKGQRAINATEFATEIGLKTGERFTN
jgi:methionyl-tRNA formyltransferase